MIGLIRSFDLPPLRVTVWRHPEVVGGQDNRFLPKELYYPETGSANSALLIEKRDETARGDTIVKIETHPELEGRIRPFLFHWLRQLAIKWGL